MDILIRVSTIIIIIFQILIYLPLYILSPLLKCLLPYYPGKLLLIFQDSRRSSDFPGIIFKLFLTNESQAALHLYSKISPSKPLLLNFLSKHQS